MACILQFPASAELHARGAGASSHPSRSPHPCSSNQQYIKDCALPAIGTGQDCICTDVQPPGAGRGLCFIATAPCLRRLRARLDTAEPAERRGLGVVAQHWILSRISVVFVLVQIHKVPTDEARASPGNFVPRCIPFRCQGGAQRHLRGSWILGVPACQAPCSPSS